MPQIEGRTQAPPGKIWRPGPPVAKLRPRPGAGRRDQNLTSPPATLACRGARSAAIPLPAFPISCQYGPADSWTRPTSPTPSKPPWYQNWEANNYFAPQGSGEPYTIMIRRRTSPAACTWATASTTRSWTAWSASAACRAATPCGSRAPTTRASPRRWWSSASWPPRASAATTWAARSSSKGLGVEGTVRRHHHRQIRRLGSSVDWSRERFTMDEGLSGRSW